MIEIAHDNFAPVCEGLGKRQAYQANERGGIHTECNFPGIGCIQKDRDRLPGTGDRGIDFLAFAIASAALDVACEQVFMDRSEYVCWNLRAGSVVEENGTAMQRGKHLPHMFNWEFGHKVFQWVLAATCVTRRSRFRSNTSSTAPTSSNVL